MLKLSHLCSSEEEILNAIPTQPLTWFAVLCKLMASPGSTSIPGLRQTLTTSCRSHLCDHIHLTADVSAESHHHAGWSAGNGLCVQREMGKDTVEVALWFPTPQKRSVPQCALARVGGTITRHFPSMMRRSLSAWLTPLTPIPTPPSFGNRVSCNPDWP